MPQTIEFDTEPRQTGTDLAPDMGRILPDAGGEDNRIETLQCNNQRPKLCSRAIAEQIYRLHGPRIAALGVLASLPRDVYGAAFVSNDVLIGFLATLSIWLHTATAQDEKKPTSLYIALLAACAMAALTKQHGLILLLLPFSILGEHIRRTRRCGAAPKRRPHAPARPRGTRRGRASARRRRP